MTTTSSLTLQMGSDPRAHAEFLTLEREMAKHGHPARLALDWSQVEQQSRSLFQQHGMDLQTFPQAAGKKFSLRNGADGTAFARA